MIAVDTSALAAIVFDEPECAAFESAILEAGLVLISAVTVVEAGMVIHRRRGDKGMEYLEAVLASPMIEIVPPGTEELDIAHAAFVQYGKGSGHPVGLNVGDMFSYALAKARGVPLLYKGADFAQTDVETAASG